MKTYFLSILMLAGFFMPVHTSILQAQDETLSASEVSASRLKVQLKIGIGLQQLNLLGEGTVFPEDTPLLVAWSLIEGATQPTDIQHVWLYNGKEIAVTPLLVKSAYYRTYTRRSPQGKAGSWMVQVKNSFGAVLASQSFDVIAVKSVP